MPWVGQRIVLETKVLLLTGIVDDSINAFWVGFFQHISEVLYALRLADVQRMKLYRGISSVSCQYACILKRWVVVQ